MKAAARDIEARSHLLAEKRGEASRVSSPGGIEGGNTQIGDIHALGPDGPASRHDAVGRIVVEDGLSRMRRVWDTGTLQAMRSVACRGRGTQGPNSPRERLRDVERDPIGRVVVEDGLVRMQM